MQCEVYREVNAVSPIGFTEFVFLMKACHELGDSMHLAVGVSGGVDSMALCLLASLWGRANGVRITALIVDHGLREASSAEAAQVAAWLLKLDIQHQILTINKLKPKTRIQAIARDWRFSAFDEWCRSNGATAVLLAHTLEDQVETLCMRIAADTGPDGLSGMRRFVRVAGLNIGRPLLSIPKTRLISTCRLHKQVWINDPSNLDIRFTRVYWRNLQTAIEEVGLCKKKVERLSTAMGTTRSFIDQACQKFIRFSGGVSPLGLFWFGSVGFSKLPLKFSELMMSRILKAVGGAKKPIRKIKITALCEQLLENSTVKKTLSGCVIEKSNTGLIWIYKEYSKCTSATTLTRSGRWDNRFEMSCFTNKPLNIELLGENGWSQFKKNASQRSELATLYDVPYGARLSLPVARHLDGTLLIPHFRGRRLLSPSDDEALVTALFKPDSDWICELV
jgi:tRNA(Ile)-lysidine synthase